MPLAAQFPNKEGPSKGTHWAPYSLISSNMPTFAIDDGLVTDLHIAHTCTLSSMVHMSKRTSKYNQFKGILLPEEQAEILESVFCPKEAILVNQEHNQASNNELVSTMSNFITCRAESFSSSQLHDKSFSNRITAYCAAELYKHQEWQSSWECFSSIWLSLYPNSCIRRWDGAVVYLSMPSSSGHVFLFEYGVVVCWGLSARQERAILSLCKRLEDPSTFMPQHDIYLEEFYYKIHEDSHICNNMIFLKSDHLIYKLILSHALAQSVKLAAFEKWLEKSVAVINSLHLFQKGQHIPRHQLTRSVGKFYDFLIKIHSKIHVFGECPEFLWHISDVFLPFYQLFYLYLDIKHRTAILKKKSSVLADTLTMLSTHSNDHHRILLLRIVIIVIFLSVFITIVRILVENSLG